MIDEALLLALTDDARSVAAFSPSQVSGLVGWWSADDLAEADGVAVASWADASGSGNPLTQSTGANRPTKQTNELNGHAIVRFDGTDDFLIANGIASVFSGIDKPFTVFAVADWGEGDTLFWFASNDASGTPYVEGAGWHHYKRDDAGTEPTAAGGSADLAPHVFVTAHTGTAVTMTVDGTVTVNGAGHDAGQTTVDLFTVGASRIDGNPANYWTGDMAEMLVYNSSLSSENRSLVETYLSAKYGLGFSPDEVSGLVGWWDFSDATKLFTDAGVTPVSADANPIYQVNDKSGGAKHGVQTVLGNRPLYKVNVQNGLSAARFDGTNDYWVTTLVVPKPTTMLVVGKVTTFAAQRNFLGSVNITDALSFQTQTSGKVAIDKVNQVAMGESTAAISAATTYALSVTYSGVGVFAFYTNGVPNGGGTSDQTWTQAAMIGVYANSEAGPMLGDIYEIVVYNSVLSTANHNAVGNYLANKWGLTWTTIV